MRMTGVSGDEESDTSIINSAQRAVSCQRNWIISYESACAQSRHLTEETG